jgi:DeoR/GlpR family transcriptional regulator of sugar metabolism
LDRKRADARIRQVDLLRAISLHEPVTISKLAEMFDRSRQAIHLRVKAMEKKGLIERVILPPEAPAIPLYFQCSQRLKDAERRLAGKEAD